MSRAWVVGMLLVGCGGSCPEASAPPVAASEAAPEAPKAEDTAAEPERSESASGKAEAPKATESPGKAEDPIVNPEFPEGASVAQAVAVIPKGVSRANIDQDTLAEPLQSESLYAPCKVGTQHFKMKVAVWNGRAVGVDVTTPNKQLAACIDKQVRNLTWSATVRSLNTVEYSM